MVCVSYCTDCRSTLNMCSLRDARVRPVLDVTPIELFRNINRFTLRGPRGFGEKG